MLLDRTIKELIVRQALVDVHREHMSDSFISGAIIEVSDHFLYLRRFDDEGRYDGLSILRKDDVTRLAWGGNEREAITRLVRRGGQLPERPKIELDSFQSVIRTLDAHFGHAVLFTEELDSDLTAAGEVEEMDEETVVLRLYGPKESLDRPHGLLHLSDVTRVEADTIHLRNLVALHQTATLRVETS